MHTMMTVLEWYVIVMDSLLTMGTLHISEHATSSIVIWIIQNHVLGKIALILLIFQLQKQIVIIRCNLTLFQVIHYISKLYFILRRSISSMCCLPLQIRCSLDDELVMVMEGSFEAGFAHSHVFTFEALISVFIIFEAHKS